MIPFPVILMSNSQDERLKAYRLVTDGLETAENPTLDMGSERREVLVLCECDERYLVWLTGNVPIPNHRGLSIFCPHCQRSIEEMRLLFGHSADVFNASWGKINAD